jgi:uncharacterized protein
MAARTDRPTFHALTRDECLVVLARNHIGRIAYSRQNRVDVEPIHYVYEEGWIFGRTSPGAKLDTLAGTFHGIWPVAFEVDEVEGLFSWRSVVVHGNFHYVDPEGASWEQEQWGKGVEALRRLIPETFTDDDPVPFRNVVFGVAVQEVSGREARPPKAA